MFLYIVVFLTVALSFKPDVYCEEALPADIYLEFTTWKYTDMSRSLLVKAYGENEDGEYPVEGITIHFFINSEAEMLPLGQAVSDHKGTGILSIPGGSVAFPKDDEGYMHFMARFDGNDDYIETEERISLKDVRIELQFLEEDGDRLIYFEGTVMGNDENQPLADDDIYFYVPRMFSNMKIADGWFEEDGKGYVEFPAHIIGDTLGNIVVMARLEDHADYGNVEVTGSINWAIPKKLLKAEGPVRELWTPIAPLWMIITLIIMLTGVWAHYFYAIFQLIMIRRSKNNKSSNEILK